MSNCSEVQTYYTKGGAVRYQIEISHDQLHKYQVMRSDDQHVLIQKAQLKMNQWDEMWNKRVIAEQKRAEREEKAETIERKKKLAEKRTLDAQNILNSMDNILNHTLSVDDTIKWDLLKNNKNFTEPQPKKRKIVPPSYKKFPKRPEETDEKYNPKLGFLDKLSKSRQTSIQKKSEKLFLDDLNEWEIKKKEIDDNNQKIKAEYNNHLRNAEKSYENELNKWKQKRESFLNNQKANNAIIENKKKLYFNSASEAILDYCDMVLSNSEYYFEFPQKYELDYNPENHILVVDYQLPSLEAIPSIKEVKYVQSRDAFDVKHLTKNQLNKIYDSVIYQISLRTIHELYEADKANALESINFNGYVNSIDPSTGKNINACILSVQANKEEFEDINLAMVEPKACFKKLKGVGSSKLHSLIPIAPIIKIDREDKRFADSYDVVSKIDEGFNLAAMDWEDFEHLIRQLFEQAFAETGGEVKVTQASRDGGIDAVIFDPDPLRGGKIVVQAKRYTNVVGVSAVRDLYGTLMNEGANKGILVTTSDYGPDAYKFIEGKPLQLLNGSNLLHLLEQHGHKARIDIKEAKLQNQ